MGMKRLFKIMEDPDQKDMFKLFVKKKKYSDLVNFAIQPNKTGDMYARYFSKSAKYKIMPKSILDKADEIYSKPTTAGQKVADGLYKACAHNDKQMAKIKKQMGALDKTIKLLTKANKKKPDQRVTDDIAKKEKEYEALDKSYNDLGKAITDMAEKRKILVQPGTKGKDKEFKALIDEAHAIIYKQVDPGIIQEYWNSNEYKMYDKAQKAMAKRGRR